MKRSMIDLAELLPGANKARSDRLRLFALLSLWIIENLEKEGVETSAARRIFFNANNCLYVRRKLRNKMADEFMSRGVQLPDLFEMLPEKEAQREFRRELKTMRSLCVRLLDGVRLVA